MKTFSIIIESENYNVKYIVEAENGGIASKKARRHFSEKIKSNIIKTKIKCLSTKTYIFIKGDKIL